jgi:hypothetical protein
MKAHNINISKGLFDMFRFKGEEAPAEVAPEIVVSYDCLPPANHNLEVTATNATSNSTTLTTSFETYIYGGTFSVIKDATATSTLSQATIFIEGRAFLLASIVGLTLTASQQTVSFSFYPPLKVDAGKDFSVTNSTNVGNVTAKCVLWCRRMVV